MAINRYSVISQSPYVPQYTPPDIGGITEVLKDARTRRDTSELQDARTSAGLANVVGGAVSEDELQFARAIEEKHLGDIQERASRGYSSQDLIKTRLAGEEAGRSLTSLQEAKQGMSQWEENFRKRHEYLSPEELEVQLQANRPSIGYNMDNLTAELQGARDVKLPDDVELAEHLDKLVKGTPSFTRDEGIVYDPQTGFMATSEDGTGRVERVTPERIRAIAQTAMGDRGVQNYLGRRQQTYTLQAQNLIESGVNPIEEAITSDMNSQNPELRAAAVELNSRVEAMRAANMSDAEIYGKIMRDHEVNTALGFAGTKYAYTNVTDRAPIGANSKRAKEMEDYVIKAGPASNNPNLLPVVEGLDSLRVMLTDKTEMQAGPFGGVSPKFTPRSDFSQDPLEYAKTPEVKETFGNSLHNAMTSAPQQNGETNKQYISRIANMVEEQVNMLASAHVVYRQPSQDEFDELNLKYLGDRNAGRLGEIVNHTIQDFTPGYETHGMDLEGMAKHLGIKVEDLKDDFLNNGVITGVVDSDPVFGKSFLLQFPSGSKFLRSGTIRRFRVGDNNLVRQEEYAHKAALANLETSIDKDEYTFNTTLSTPKGRVPVKLRAKARNVYTDESTGRKHYQDEINFNEYYAEDGNSPLRFSERTLIFEQLDEDGNVIDTVTDPATILQIKQNIGN